MHSLSNEFRPQEPQMFRRRSRYVGLIALTLILCGGCQTIGRLPLMPQSAGLPPQYESRLDESR